MCGASGLWTPLIGSCTLTDQDDNLTYNSLLGGLGGTNGQCLLGIIPPLGGTVTYTNGRSMGPYPQGTMATLSCQTGIPTGNISFNGISVVLFYSDFFKTLLLLY